MKKVLGAGAGTRQVERPERIFSKEITFLRMILTLGERAAGRGRKRIRAEAQRSIEERQEERDATERARILEKGALQKDYGRESGSGEARREMARGLDADTLKVVAQNKL